MDTEDPLIAATESEAAVPEDGRGDDGLENARRCGQRSAVTPPSPGVRRHPARATGAWAINAFMAINAFISSSSAITVNVAPTILSEVK
jgi:hypothetical protein